MCPEICIFINHTRCSGSCEFGLDPRWTSIMSILPAWFLNASSMYSCMVGAVHQCQVSREVLQLDQRESLVMMATVLGVPLRGRLSWVRDRAVHKLLMPSPLHSVVRCAHLWGPRGLGAYAVCSPGRYRRVSHRGKVTGLKLHTCEGFFHVGRGEDATRIR